MKIRKLILLIADAILLAVLIVNFAVSSKSSIKTFEIKDEINSIVITKADGEILLTKNGDEWFVGSENLLADEYSVENLIDAISSIKVLDKVASLNEYTTETYEFTEKNVITVTAKKNDKLLRKIQIGKNSSVYSQSFITLDDKNDIYLATGSLRTKFDVAEENLLKPAEEEATELEATEVEPASAESEISDGEVV